jgi:hypothetical protein
MYISGQSPMQKDFFDLFFHVMNNHSEKSKKSFIQNLERLHTRYENRIVEIYGVHRGQEVSLLWRNKNEYDEPISEPVLVGGLVYHAHSDSWSVNT